jgi:hypothetical protein
MDSRTPWHDDGRLTRRTIVLAFVVPSALLALSILWITRDTERRSASVLRAVEPAAMTTTAGGPSGAPFVERTGISSSEFIEATDDGEPPQENRVAPAKRYGTVQQAAAESCSTASVEGLSRQIIEQACGIEPSGLVPLPTHPNLALASNVFPYLELEVRDHLLRALETHSSGKQRAPNGGAAVLGFALGRGEALRGNNSLHDPVRATTRLERRSTSPSRADGDPHSKSKRFDGSVPQTESTSTTKAEGGRSASRRMARQTSREFVSKDLGKRLPRRNALGGAAKAAVRIQAPARRALL